MRFPELVAYELKAAYSLPPIESIPNAMQTVWLSYGEFQLAACRAMERPNRSRPPNPSTIAAMRIGLARIAALCQRADEDLGLEDKVNA